MKKTRYLVLFFLTLMGVQVEATPPHVLKKVLKNGLTVLVRTVKTTQDVSAHILYHVGSKDEDDGTKGLAHFLEHMTFKGTAVKGVTSLSETDIDEIVEKLSASHNAATSYDWTRYYFNFPKQHWEVAFDIFADCMCNCTFKQELINSELKVVIQELKMRRDRFNSCLWQNMTATIFADHPYHYPVIGYKQDLWHMTHDNLMQFYKKHYIPNNAVVVVVGDVDPEKVFALAEEKFGHIPADLTYTKKKTYLTKDICAQSVTLYREIQQPFVWLAFLIPGLTQVNYYARNTLLESLSGKGSRLYKKLVDELQIAQSIGCFCNEAFDHDLFIVSFVPTEKEQISEITDYVLAQIADIAQHGLTKDELERSVRLTKAQRYDLMEHNFSQAELIGINYLALGDENIIFTYQIDNLEKLNEEIKEFCQDYLRESVMHEGMVLPLPENEKIHWKKLEQDSDAQDKKFLQERVRTCGLEEPQFAKQLKPGRRPALQAPKPTELMLKNGLKVLYYHNPNVPKISISLDLKVDSSYCPEKFPCISNLVSDMMLEGTEKYPGQTIIHECHQRAIGMQVGIGGCSANLVKEELPLVLDMITQVYTQCTFGQKEFEKITQQARIDYKQFLDNQKKQGWQLAHKHIYKGHPYGISRVPTPEQLDAITIDDLKEFYTQYSSPHGATLCLVGDLGDCKLEELLEKTLGTWKGKEIPDFVYPALATCEPKELKHTMERNQTTILCTGLSVDRYHEDYHALALFSGILNKHLFQLRETTGAFYGIDGSAVTPSKQPCTWYVSTMVSPERLEEVKELLKKTIDELPNLITQEELEAAREELLNAPANNYSTNAAIRNTFMALNKFDLGFDFHERRPEILNAISLDDVKTAAKKIFNTQNMIIVEVGRDTNPK